MDELIFKNGQFTESEIRRVAMLHKHGIESDFLSALGESFLEKIYTAVARSKEGVLILAIKGGEVIGFAGGTLSKRLIADVLLKNGLFKSLLMVLPHVFSIQALKKVIGMFAGARSSGDKKKHDLSVELLGMAVDEPHREQGIGQILFAQMVDAFQERGAGMFKITVNDALIPAQCLYEKVGAQKQGQLELRKGETASVYVYDIKSLEKPVYEEPAYLRRYLALFRQLGQPALVLDGILWTAYQRMVVPVGPASTDYGDTAEKYRDYLLWFFKNCVLIRSGSGFIQGPEAWYAVICDRFIDLGELSLKSRAQARRGLRNCSVRKIDARFLAEHGWPVLLSAFKRYKSRPPEDEFSFRRKILLTEGFEDIVHYWGVFEQETGKFIAYAQNYIYDKKEVNYWIINFHPDFLRLNLSHALMYEMNKYYLGDEKFACANNGFRNLLHQTGIQDYLVHKFQYKKQPVGLQVYYRPLLEKCMAVSYPGRGLLGRAYSPLGALYKMEELRRQSMGTEHKNEKEYRLI